MTTIIRHVRPEDIPALIDLAAETFLDSFGDYHTAENCKIFIEQSHNANIYETAITAPLDHLLLAEQNGKLQAYLYAKPTTLPVPQGLTGAHELSKFYTRKDVQGQGLGIQLLKNWEAWAKAQKQTDLVLGVWSENHDAQRFYNRYGYSKIAEYKLSVGEVQDTDYIYHKAL